MPLSNLSNESDRLRVVEFLQLILLFLVSENAISSSRIKSNRLRSTSVFVHSSIETNSLYSNYLWPRPLPMHERRDVDFGKFNDIASDSLACPGFKTCPWYEIGTTPSTTEWTRPTKCNPYSRVCSCLSEWLGSDNICPSWAYTKERSTKPPAPELITLATEGWLNEWPYVEGVRKCAKSYCDVRHTNFYSPDVDARVFSLLHKSVPPFEYGRGAISVGVSMESPNNFPKLDEESFQYTFHFGVSHRRGHLDLQTSYNNYFPAQFKSKGAPFLSKKNSLLFVYTACHWPHRNQLFDDLSKLIDIDALGRCKNNKNMNDMFPACAALPRSGTSVWLQSECLLHNYKFYLAIENTREPDYITEKLYQGLRAGSVPVYLGAPNVRDYLPDNAAVYLDDFASLSDLVKYLKSAMEDETLYNKHHAWKDLPLPGRFVNTALEMSQDLLHCQICDHIATKYKKELPLLNNKGKSIAMPPCITKMLLAAETTILRDFQPPAPLWRHKSPPKVDKVYVISIVSATDRHKVLRQQLSNVFLSGDLVTSFDRNQISDADHGCLNPYYYEVDIQIRRPLSRSEVSLAMKQTAAMFDAFRRGNKVSLIIEDDVRFEHTFLDSLEQVLEEAPNGWDLIFIGGCMNMHAEHYGRKKVTDKLWRTGQSRCAHAYLISEQGVIKALNHLPIISPFDFHLSYIQNVTIYWVEPAEVHQSGFKTLLNNTYSGGGLIELNSH
jgi:hypothetical protein